MNKKITIELTETAHALAQKRATEAGFESLDTYIDALIRYNDEIVIAEEGLRQRLEEGVKSGSSGTLTKEKLHRLVNEGIARVKHGA